MEGRREGRRDGRREGSKQGKTEGRKEEKQLRAVSVKATTHPERGWEEEKHRWHAPMRLSTTNRFAGESS